MIGNVYLVGIGPGHRDDMTPRALKTIATSDVVIGHSSCLALIADLVAGKEVVGGDMSPVERSDFAINRAQNGNNVAIVTTGDPGVYAIASTFFNSLRRARAEIDVSVVPGLTAASSASALLGSPIGHDFAAVSLADRAESWGKIMLRLKAAVEAGFVLVLYNPVGKVGDWRLKRAFGLLKSSLETNVPVGIVSGLGAAEQKVVITTLGGAASFRINAQSIIIIGNAATFVYRGRMVTPRGYIEGVGY